MYQESEERRLAHTIVLDLEDNNKNLHMICMQASRLALLLNNPEKSKFFTEKARTISETEAFLSSYGLIIHDLIKKIDLDDLYELNNLDYRKFSKLLSSSYMAASGSIPDRRDPIADIKKYWSYKEKHANMQSEVYDYAMNILYQLKFSEKVLDIFTEYEERVNNLLPELMPNSKEKLDSISKSLQSQNREDWSNAVHVCRKLIQNFADALYPPSNEPIIDKNGKVHPIGEVNYLNRLKNYVYNHSTSEKFMQITNANMKYISDRMDAIYEASNKGTHETITSVEEAKRYVIHTYLLIGDILSLE